MQEAFLPVIYAIQTHYHLIKNAGEHPAPSFCKLD